MIKRKNIYLENNKNSSIFRDEHVRKNLFSNLNQKSFKNMLKYLSTLKQHNVINDKEFVKLVNYSCGIFIENELEKRFTNILEEKVKNRLNRISY